MLRIEGLHPHAILPTLERQHATLENGLYITIGYKSLTSLWLTLSSFPILVLLVDFVLQLFLVGGLLPVPSQPPPAVLSRAGHFQPLGRQMSFACVTDGIWLRVSSFLSWPGYLGGSGCWSSHTMKGCPARPESGCNWSQEAQDRSFRETNNRRCYFTKKGTKFWRNAVG